MINRVEFYIDKVSAPRFSVPKHYLPALNIAIDRYIKDRYDNIHLNKPYSFQVLERIRDELRTIVKNITAAPVGNLIAFPVDYMHAVSLQVIINGIKVPSRASTYSELGVIEENSFEVPTPDEPVHLEDQTGITVRFGGIGIFSSYDLGYIRKPATVFKSTITLSQGPLVLTIGSRYYVITGPVIHNAVLYGPGAEFVAVATGFTGTGTVVEIVNCDLPDNTHEEICKMAAELIEKTVEDYPKSNALEQELNKS